MQRNHSHVVIVEDDMLFSPDFLLMFKATAPLLDRDPMLWCVSTWNDNGLKTFEWQPTRMVLVWWVYGGLVVALNGCFYRLFSLNGLFLMRLRMCELSPMCCFLYYSMHYCNTLIQHMNTLIQHMNTLIH